MVEFEDIFSVQIFFIILRETVECAVIVSVLLAFLEQNLSSPSTSSIVKNQNLTSTSASPNPEAQLLVSNGDNADDNGNDIVKTNSILYNTLKWHIWLGSLAGLFVCLLLGGFFVFLFYLIKVDLWSKSEHYWEGIFSLLASIVISVMGFGMIKIGKMKSKWKYKLSKLFYKDKLSQNNTTAENDFALNNVNSNGSSSIEREIDNELNQALDINKNSWKNKLKFYTEKYSLFILPFITTMREGMEAVVFVGGVGVSEPFSSFPLSIILATAIGFSIGYFLYKSGNSVSIQKFLVYSTCFLYVVASGLFSKGFWNFELQKYIDDCNGQDLTEVGNGPGSYDISKSIWHVNCCNGQTDGLWMLAAAIFGWTNSATYISVLTYDLYWIGIVIIINMLKYEEKHGFLPFIPIKYQKRRLLKKLEFYDGMRKFSELENQVNSMPISAPIHIAQSTDTLDSNTPLITHSQQPIVNKTQNNNNNNN
ncbi:iron permease FTR1 [Ascoidea rubescens DSM 1968]|uniref:Iron permease FTR1 n=1 Tax=Ascoidea rubescens DSM 1968 TaxID=1344418 RepID=A0A1D2VIF9_9ASCO|nr:iron permease FTR1 [Ascoidea rubescens DSM 1968]ODV61428.1 iron permease FTR1 [Ascoidea rubescens DSM 1968]